VYTFIALIASIFLLDEPAHRERDEKVPLRQLMTPTLFNVMLIYGFAMFLGIANSQCLLYPLFLSVHLIRIRSGYFTPLRLHPD
jgi:hypothetical protein